MTTPWDPDVTLDDHLEGERIREALRASDPRVHIADVPAWGQTEPTPMPWEERE